MGKQFSREQPGSNITPWYNQATKTVKNPGYPFFNLQPFIDIYVHTTTKPRTKSLITDNNDSTHRYSMIILTSSNKISE